MIVRYSGGITGARQAARSGATTVVVDAYRASTTIAVLVSKGARVLPVASVREAEDADVDLRVGERGSVKLSGFDFGNSPAALRAANIPPGARVALTTTNGTRVLEAAAGAPRIYAASFVNARAVADELEGLAAAEDRGILIVGCGWEGNRSSEDEAAAGAILHRLGDSNIDLDARARRAVQMYKERTKESLKNNSAARRLKRLGYTDDLDFCLDEDSIPVVPRLVDRVFVERRK